MQYATQVIALKCHGFVFFVGEGGNEGEVYAGAVAAKERRRREDLECASARKR